MKKRTESLREKIFGSFGMGNSRVPLHTNVFHSGGGYNPIGGSGRWNPSNPDRQSPLLGSATPSNRMSAYYERIDELKSYRLLDISKLAISFFYDYVINFLEDNGQQLIDIIADDGSIIQERSEQINNILIQDLKIFDYIRDHEADSIFYGSYTSLLLEDRNELGHKIFRFEELNDPVSVISKKKKNSDGHIEEIYLARGEDGKIYEIASQNAFMLGSINLRLVNDLEESWKKNKKDEHKVEFAKDVSENLENLEKVIKRCSYSTGEPLFYSSILKVKELIVKEILVSLISMRDISSTQIFLLQFDKSTPKETANELCARTTKLANNTNELASFLTSKFDVPSFIENTLTQSAKFVPDYNATLGNKNNMLPLDKLSDKLIDIMQNLDMCRNSVLSPLGIPSTITDSTSGSKWVILQQSERANSRVAGFMQGIKESISNLVCTLYKSLYNEELNPGSIKLHISEKTSVEYNNQINQSESINGLLGGISGILTGALQTLEQSSPLIDVRSYLSYIQGLIKDIDPDTENLINEQTIEIYANFAMAKLQAMCESQGIDPSILNPPQEQ